MKQNPPILQMKEVPRLLWNQLYLQIPSSPWKCDFWTVSRHSTTCFESITTTTIKCWFLYLSFWKHSPGTVSSSIITCTVLLSLFIQTNTNIICQYHSQFMNVVICIWLMDIHLLICYLEASTACKDLNLRNSLYNLTLKITMLFWWTIYIYF